MIITVANVKGGVAKTTSAVYLAHGLAAGGARVALVDTDPRQSAYRWSTLAGELGEPWELDVLPWASPEVARQVGRVRETYEHLVIDTPAEETGIITPSLHACDLLVVPVSPSAMEVHRLGDTFIVAGQVAAVHDFDVRVLLVKVRAGTTSASVAREVLGERDDYPPVFATEVPLREMYPASYGHRIADLGTYADVLIELRTQATS